MVLVVNGCEVCTNPDPKIIAYAHRIMGCDNLERIKLPPKHADPKPVRT